MKIQVLADEIKRFSGLYGNLKNKKLLIIADEHGIQLKAHDEDVFLSNYIVSPVEEPGTVAVSTSEFFDAFRYLDGMIEASTKPLKAVRGTKAKGACLHFATEQSSYRIGRLTALEKEAEELTIFETSEVKSSFAMSMHTIPEILKRAFTLDSPSKPFLSGIQISYDRVLSCLSSNGNLFSKVIITNATVKSTETFRANIPFKTWRIVGSLIALKDRFEWIADGLHSHIDQSVASEESTEKPEPLLQVNFLDNYLIRFQIGDQVIVSRILSQAFPEKMDLMFSLPANKVQLKTETRKKLFFLQKICEKDGSNLTLQIDPSGAIFRAENPDTDGVVVLDNVRANPAFSALFTIDFFQAIGGIQSEDYSLFYHDPETPEDSLLKPVILKSVANGIQHLCIAAVLNPRRNR